MNEDEPNSMLPFEPNTLCSKVGSNFLSNMPRVVSNQRHKFENDELFRKLSRECEIKYTGFRDRPIEERQLRFQTECREGHADIAFVPTGTNLHLNFLSNPWSDKAEDRVATQDYVDFDRESGKVHLKSQFIMNGVCVVWRGWIDLNRLDGVGCLEFDAERAEVEDALLREQIDQYNRQLRDFEDRQRQYHEEQERRAEAEAEEYRCLLRQRVEMLEKSQPLQLSNDKSKQSDVIPGAIAANVASSPRRKLSVKDEDSKGFRTPDIVGVRIPVPRRAVAVNNPRQLFPWKPHITSCQNFWGNPSLTAAEWLEIKWHNFVRESRESHQNGHVHELRTPTNLGPSPTVMLEEEIYMM